MDQILEVLSLFLSVENILMIALGVVIGVVIGAIPGLTATMAVALALPFTFGMEPVTAILLLVGIYKGGMYGGSITAILIRTPGSPASASTLLDGYPMAQKGEAKKALSMALYASCIADFISNLSLIFLAGYLAKLALSFGPPEYFWLICFSLTIIISVSGDSVMKGLIAAALGVILALVGMDPVYGTERLTFDNYNLMDRINFIPLLIGLFAIPEILEFYLSRAREHIQTAVSGADVTWQELKGSMRSIIRGSFIGVIIGAIPGTGATAASFISYSEARRNSPNRDNFGKGEIEGVAAAEAGNNAVAGATMIPLLSLGIPGDVITAIILGAFMIHGLTPGPILFQENMNLIYALFCGIMLSSVVLFGTGKLAIRYFSRIADVPKQILFPIVLMFCIYGAYAVNNSTFDIAVMLVFGLVGFIFNRTGFASAPFLIGFILGPMLEDNFRRSLLISNNNFDVFVRGPIDWFFIALTVLSLGFALHRYIQSLRTH
ncbi:C4-dicarboxylate ABC transporter permease [Pseudomonas stutzeri]|jgi:putative tricarboxylic transport membrane protein|uniref:C4-dicarboxylate ABC transporter permease n=1 Tax=Stutzerimonas stutzeri KOS6 TaxID=1218352 RepID=A0A061JWI7_STUST|nr:MULTISPECIES: tripartite tricarboxylate transporter permease [Stutzerimonas]HAG19457.1 C4-dicarboxylate ABC transporter permease [Pseudomonas sp.]EWC43059.1 C4-dicarboxylate ABC transporter permease [Stutzerimonas stutzeri KOS6]MBK3868819.1 C4-dicarboxylate ABC transporter permease [Stutzerimonas stutzeri]MBK3882162.1 C4-dicarboxylate ABC transporter permease [Stutzerimonas stutzeri]MDL2176219.1 tripartite tricarboxylate transporter permease [Stutzerimonas sp. FeSN7]